MKKGLLVFLVLLGFACSPPVADAQGKAEWLDDLQKAQAQAKAENKALLLDFTGSDWCVGCQIMHKEVFPTAEFASYAKTNLVLLEVDFPIKKSLPKKVEEQNEALSKKYEIEGYPTLILLSPDGKKLGQLEYSGENAKALIAKIEQVRTKK